MPDKKSRELFLGLFNVQRRKLFNIPVCSRVIRIQTPLENLNAAVTRVESVEIVIRARAASPDCQIRFAVAVVIARRELIVAGDAERETENRIVGA